MRYQVHPDHVAMGDLMRHIWIGCAIAAAVATMGHAQTNGFAPAELPSADFEGREYVDSRGCVFLRSTFGGQVTWVPRYGPDRQPVCNGTPDGDTVQAEVAPEVTVPAPVMQTQPVEMAATPAPQAPPRATPPARRTPARSTRQRAVPKADASGRHPSCPASAPFGQLVDTTLGRPLVRCVTSPALFLAPVHNGRSFDPNAPIALPGGDQQSERRAPLHSSATRGSVVQVGSFSVPSNATRLRARLLNSGLPANVYATRGYDVVTLGPFASPTEAQYALASVRGMGFSDAFIRR